MAIGINDLTFLFDTVDQIIPPKSFFRDHFFPNQKSFPTEKILIDYRKGTQKMAPYIVPGSSGPISKRRTFETKEYACPMIGSARNITIADLQERGFGEQIYGQTLTPMQRAISLHASDIADMTNEILRRDEWACSQVITKLAFDVKSYNNDGALVTSDVVDFSSDFTHKHIYTGTDLWSNASAPMFDQIFDAVHEISEDSGVAPNYMVANYKTLSLMLTNTEIMKYLQIPDQNNFNMLSIRPKIISPDVLFFASIPRFGLDIYEYDGTFVDDSGTTQKFIPDGTVVVSNPGRGRHLIGTVSQIEDNQQNIQSYPGQEIVPKIWSDVQNDTYHFRLVSRSLPCPYSVDDWSILQVL